MLSVDQLADPAAPIQVVLFDGFDAGDASARGARPPHRHDYHELLWSRAGEVTHRLDGRRLTVPPGTITVIGRGQVHVLERAKGLEGAAIRFTDEALYSGGALGAGWMLGALTERVVEVPAGDVTDLESTIAALHAETNRPLDQCSAELQRHLLATLLLWIERWYDAAQLERPPAGDGAARLHRRFVGLLEAGYRRHHDAAHYADALAVPPAALSRALTEVTGHGTKALITDRVMIEAARLLRFTDDTIGEVAHATGFDDPLYFSRAFKRRYGQSPLAYRASIRGH